MVPLHINMGKGSVTTMPFDEENPGEPFPGDFPERIDHARRAGLEAAVQRQVTDLSQRRGDPASRHEILRVLGERRSGDPGGPEGQALEHTDGSVPTRFSYLPLDDGFDTLLVHGELLITAESYHASPGGAGGPSSSDRAYLDSLQMTASEVDCEELHGRVLRLTRAGMGPEELADVAVNLRARGFNAALSNITPTAPITKGIGGPAPASGPGTGPGEPGEAALVKVAIIDTGICRERTDEWLEAIPRNGNIDPLDVFPPPSGDGFLDLDAGHGTFVAGIVQQVAPNADIRVYRAVDSDGVASEVAVACAMIHAVRNGAQILNLSLACQAQDDIPPLALKAALDVIEEIERAENREVVIVAAAGNYGDTRPAWPAAFRRVVSVAALTADLRPAPWSSRGFWVSCAAVGQGVTSTYVEGRESPLLDRNPASFGPDPWGVWSGTSFTTPQIAGALARVAGGGIPLGEAVRRLLGAGRPVPGFGQALKILPGV
jgi:subtilase family protein